MSAQQYVLDGRFALGDMIEQRPYGDFYHCSDQQTGQPALLFISQPTALPTPELVARARQEITTVAQLSPGVLPVLYLNVLPDQRLFFVTVVPPQVTLTARIGQAVMSLSDATALVSRICEALQVAASKGVFHRELEPTNIYLDESGNVFLSNFGIARQVAQGIFGNPWFMAPEQVNGADPGLPANIYSMGMILYYMVTGVPPFSDGDPGVLLNRHRHDTPVAPSKIRPDVVLPTALDTVFSRATAKDPAQRYPNYQSFLQDLQALTVSTVSATAAAPVAPVAAAPVAAAPAAVPAAAAPSAPARQQEPISLTNPVSAPAAPEAQEDGDDPSGRKAPRRRQKGGFRETLWFKKGEESKDEAAVKAEDLMKVEKGTGTISDKDKTLEERYRDGAEELSVDDRRKFSVRTGQTGVFQAVKVEDLKAAEQKREVAEEHAAKKRKKNQIVFGVLGMFLLAGAIVGGIFAANHFLYKPLFGSTPFEEIETAIQAVKGPPPPQFKTVKDKEGAELFAAARKAFLEMKLVPATAAGDGTSAAELIMSVKQEESTEEELKKVRQEFVRTGLSRDYLASRTKDLDHLVLLADTMFEFWPEQPAVLKFREVVSTMRRLKREEFPPEMVKVFPYYPLPDFCVEPSETEEKALFEKFKGFLAEKRIFEPDENKQCAVPVFLKFKAVSAQLRKPDRAIAKVFPKMEQEMHEMLRTQLEEAIKADDWSAIRRGLDSAFKLNPQSPVGMEMLKKLEGKFPPDMLELSDLSKLEVPK